MNRRWHQTPRTTAAVLLIPAATALAGTWLALSAITGRQFAAAVMGHNHLGPGIVRTIAIAAGIGLAIAAAATITHQLHVRSPRAMRRRFLHSPGWATRPRRNPNTAAGIRARLHYLLPRTPRPRVADASVLLGRDARGRDFLLTCDESMLVIGPPGSGKDRRVAAPVLAAWPGPALVTSTKLDLVTATIEARATRGPIAVFDPAGFAAPAAGAHAPTALRWNPVAGCQDRDVAARRAAALIAGGTPSMSEKFWATAATRILRATLQAAALSSGSVLDACDWATSTSGWITAAQILRANGEHEWATALRDDADLDPRTTSSIAATLSATLIGVSNARLRAALAPTGDSADLGQILQANGTIYAVAPAESDGHLVFRPWTTLLASEVAAVLREQAKGARLEPPALLLLNELVHVCPLPELPGLLADGRGHNIATLAIVQDPVQLAARYSPDEAKAIVAAAQHRLLLATGSDDTAREWSAQIGTYRAKTTSRTHKAMGVTADSTNTGYEDRPILPENELRHIPYGCAVLLPRGQAAIPLHLLGQ
jgi:type IV secretory pathway TraG/TraD family ATPase VirD4